MLWKVESINPDFPLYLLSYLFRVSFGVPSVLQWSMCRGQVWQPDEENSNEYEIRTEHEISSAQPDYRNSPEYRQVARKRYRSQWGRPNVFWCQTALSAAFARCDRIECNSPYALDLWYSSPTPAASSTWTWDSYHRISRKSSFRSPAIGQRRPDAASQGSGAWHAAISAAG